MATKAPRATHFGACGRGPRGPPHAPDGAGASQAPALRVRGGAHLRKRIPAAGEHTMVDPLRLRPPDHRVGSSAGGVELVLVAHAGSISESNLSTTWRTSRHPYRLIKRYRPDATPHPSGWGTKGRQLIVGPSRLRKPATWFDRTMVGAVNGERLLQLARQRCHRAPRGQQGRLKRVS